MVLSSRLFLKILVESNRFHYALLLVWYLWYSALSAWILLAIKGKEKGNFRCCLVPFQFSFSVLIYSSQILYSFFVIFVGHRFFFFFLKSFYFLTKPTVTYHPLEMVHLLCQIQPQTLIFIIQKFDAWLANGQHYKLGSSLSV